MTKITLDNATVFGFTGTRNGMTEAQGQAFNEFVCSLLNIEEFHHGDCVGADDEAADALHEIATGEDPGPQIKVVCHPPSDESHRAFNPHYDTILPPKTHFARNRDIVDCCDALITCPPCKPLPESGGTAYTVNYALKKGKPVHVIWPNGDVECLNG